jgi:hypothetical protein
MAGFFMRSLGGRDANCTSPSDPDGTRTIAGNAGKTAVSQEDGSQSGSTDTDLARLIAVWPKLKKADRQFLTDWPQLSATKRKAIVALLAALLGIHSGLNHSGAPTPG